MQDFKKVATDFYLIIMKSNDDKVCFEKIKAKVSNTFSVFKDVNNEKGMLIEEFSKFERQVNTF